MGKAARRSVANNPSTPSYYDTYIIEPKGKTTTSSAATTTKIPPTTPAYYSDAAINATASSSKNGTFHHGRNATNASTPTTTRSYSSNKTPEQLAAERAAAERERIREEFYATYDVMTGVRIAATLGCFFAFMVFLIAYKSRNKDDGMNDPDVAATTATLVQEEEEREEQEVWEATQRAIYEAELDLDLDTCENRSRKRPRLLSLGNLNVPPTPSLTRRYEPTLRFSSVGGGFGYNGLLKPPPFRRYSAASFVSYDRYRRGSMVTVGPLRKRSTSMESPRVSSASNRVLATTNATEKAFRRHKTGSDSDGDEADDEFEQITVTADINHQPSTFLSVPKGQDSRRSSGCTCCSTESSFLERRCSAMSLGITSLPGVSRRSSFRDDIDLEAGVQPTGGGAQTIVQQRPHTTYATTHIHPEIEIIKATPRTSPNLSVSDRQSMQMGIELKPLTTQQTRRATISVTSDDKGFDYIAEYPDEVVVEKPTKVVVEEKRQQQQTTPDGRAPLASLSSFKLSSAECNDSIELQSLGSDTVFDDYYADTEDDMDPLSTDSDELSEECVGASKRKTEPSPRKSILKNAATTATTTNTTTANSTDSNNKCTCDSITISHAGSSGTGSGLTTNEIIIVSDGKGNKIGILPRFSSNSISIINTETFETKAIIERHEPDKNSTQTSLSQPFTTVKFPVSTTTIAPSNPDPCGGSDTNLQKHRAKKLKKIQEEQERKRPASTMMNYSLSTLQKKIWGNSGARAKKDHPESDNSNEKTSKLSKTKANNKKPSKHSDSNSSSLTDEIIPAMGESESKENSDSTNRRHDIVVRDLSPCVVLELPILAAQGETKEREEERQEKELATNNTLDPEAPSTSRKWSRETLF